MRNYFVLIVLFNILKEYIGNEEKKVIAYMESNWKDTPLVFETSEWFSDYSSLYYWKFVEKLSEIDLNNKNLYTSQKSEYDVINEIIKQFNLNGYQKNSLLFALSIRKYSPKINMFDQIYEEVNLRLKEKCSTTYFIQIQNSILCDIQALISHLNDFNSQLQKQPFNSTNILVYKSVDHRYPSPSYNDNQHPNIPIAILYSDFRTPHFVESHAQLSLLAKQGLIHYYYRPVFSGTNIQNTSQIKQFKTYLSGYGIELAIKNTEYQAKNDDQFDDTFERIKMNANTDTVVNIYKEKDFVPPNHQLIQGLNFTQLRKAYGGTSDNGTIESAEKLLSNNIELKRLKAWELQDLSFQAAQLIAKMDGSFADKIALLRDFSQNFPSRAPILSGVKVDQKFQEEITHNQHTFEGYNIAPGDSIMFVNGLVVDIMDNFNIYQLMELLDTEHKPMSILNQYGIKRTDMIKLLDTPLEIKEDEIALDFSGKAIKWCNDIESDAMYSQWSPHLSVMEQTFWFGMILEIRKNLYNVVILVSPLDYVYHVFRQSRSKTPHETLEHVLAATQTSISLLKELKKMYTNKLPLHIGIVLTFLPNQLGMSSDKNANSENTSDKLADDPTTIAINKYDRVSRLIFAIIEYARIHGKRKGIKALDNLIQIMDILYPNNGTTLNDELFTDVNKMEKLICSEVVSEHHGLQMEGCLALAQNEKFITDMEESVEYYENSGLDSTPQVLFNGLPLTNQQMDPVYFEKEMKNLLARAYYKYYETYYNMKITDKTDIIQYLNKRSNVLPRINKNILSTSIVPLSDGFIDFSFGVPDQNLELDENLYNAYLPSIISNHLQYIYKKTDSPVKPITLWIIADFDTPAGLSLLTQMIKFLKSSLYSRIALIHNIKPIDLDPVESTKILSNIMNVKSLNQEQLKTFVMIKLHGIKIAIQSALLSSTINKPIGLQQHQYGVTGAHDMNTFKLFINKLSKVKESDLNKLLIENFKAISNNKINNEINSNEINGNDDQANILRKWLELLLERYGVSNLDKNAIIKVGAQLYHELLSTVTQNSPNMEISKNMNRSLFDIHYRFCRYVLLVDSSQTLVIANGKIIKPLENKLMQNAIPFTASDFSLMEKFLYNAVSKTISKTMESELPDMNTNSDLSLNDNGINDLIMKLSCGLLISNARKQSSTSSMTTSFNSGKRIRIKLRKSTHGSCFSLEKQDDPTGAEYSVLVILNPISKPAQIMSQVLMVLSETLPNIRLKVCFNCKPKLSEMPLQSYYRYVLNSKLTYSDAANAQSFPLVPSATFEKLPKSPLYTMIVHTPQNWMVQSVRTPYDLDNIHLSEVPTNVVAPFELEYLLLEGQCYDKTSDKPPKGLQLNLGPLSNPLAFDTLVMANLHYFQMKANPGTFLLRLRAGRSEEIYKIVSHRNTDTDNPESQEVMVVIDSFLGKTVHLKVSKKPDKQNEEILSDTENAKSTKQDKNTDVIKDEIISEEDEEIMSSIDKPHISSVNETINVFSVASGHLYERFLKIMMLSVLKHTKNPVKFWFLKNYLSPSFKDFIPYMAREYGFKYELVQYNWPQWLNQQTEKQRIIWGYKILFLDVLFPLEVNKFIFVDADQVVRTDLKELIDLDLEGAPYGYTPFCDSRKEMEGFRFWKTGYWKSHLGHRAYHISALYVVDLKKFRQIAAGDRLRGQYIGLSQDPNSLSNLDQDLPNNMIHQVAIKSLPQDWLWCETWCDDVSKATAKTIDLCNNPQTKEPKLERAIRIVPEWTEYDNEIQNLTRKLIRDAQNHQLNSKTIGENVDLKELPHADHNEL